MTSDPALILFAAGVIWLGYVYAGYPALLYLAGLFHRVRPRVEEEYLPPVSVLIAARNEERDIGWKVAETLAWDYPADRLQVLVASDASEDRTDQIVKAFDDSRVTLVRMERRGGKGRALNRLAELAAGEILLFTDANAHIGPQALRRMVRHFGDLRVGCVTGTSRPLGSDSGSAIGGGARVFLGYEGLIAGLESRLGSVLACDGAIFCIRRGLFRTLTPELANDLELPLRIRHAGFWTLFEPAAIVRERDTASVREELARRRRITAQTALAMSVLAETLYGFRRLQFVSHKLLRYLTIVPLACLLAGTAALPAGLLYAGATAVQTVFYALAMCGLASALAGRNPGPFMATPFYIVFGSVGALAGIVDACRRRKFDVWDIPALSRGTAQSGSR